MLLNRYCPNIGAMYPRFENNVHVTNIQHSWTCRGIMDWVGLQWKVRKEIEEPRLSGFDVMMHILYCETIATIVT